MDAGVAESPPRVVIRPAYVLEEEGENFASAVAVADGNVLVSRADGEGVTAYVPRDDTWSPQVLQGVKDGKRFGYSLAVHGSDGFVGARPLSVAGGGLIQTFKLGKGVWHAAGDLRSSRPHCQSGYAVAAVHELLVTSLVCAEGTVLETFQREGHGWRRHGIAALDRQAEPSPIVSGDDFIALRDSGRGAIVLEVSREGEMTTTSRLVTTFQEPVLGIAASSQRVFLGGVSGAFDVFERGAGGWVRSGSFAAPPDCHSHGHLSANRAGTLLLPCERGKALVLRAADGNWIVAAELEAPRMLRYAVTGISDSTAVIGVPDAWTAYFFRLPAAWARENHEKP